MPAFWFGRRLRGVPGLRGRDMMSLNHGKGRSLPYGKGKGFDKGKGYGTGAKNTSPAMPPLPAGFESVPGIPAKGAEANAVQGMQALPVRSSAAPRMPAASAAKNGMQVVRQKHRRKMQHIYEQVQVVWQDNITMGRTRQTQKVLR